MRTKTTALLILVFILVYNHGNSQSLYLKAGFGTSNVKTDAGKQHMGLPYSVGLESFVFLNERTHIFLNPSIDYLSTAYSGKNSINSLFDKARVNYLVLSVPVLINFSRTIADKGNGSGYFGFGPFVGYALNGKYELYTSDDEIPFKFGNGLTDNRKTLDAGAAIKFGYHGDKFSASIQDNIGYMNVIPSQRISGGSYIKTRAFLFQLSFKLF